MEFKICSKCGRKLPLTDEYFYKRKDSKIGFRSCCKECWQNRNKAYDKRNYERISEHKKEYREVNKEHIREYHRMRYLNNKDKINREHKVYRDSHKAEIKLYRKKYFQTDKGKAYARIYCNKRRALKWLNGGEYTQEQWKDCLEFFENKCAYTGVDISECILHVDHIIPLSKGGTNDIWNICPSCKDANLSKGNRELERWYRKQDYFSEDRLKKIYNWIEYAQLIY